MIRVHVRQMIGLLWRRLAIGWHGHRTQPSLSWHLRRDIGLGEIEKRRHPADLNRR